MSDASESHAQRVFFHARLTPHRSLSPRNFRRIMLAVVAVSLTISIGLSLAGAWPAFGFMGLDILLVYLALKASYRSARIVETVELNERELTVERTDLRGRRQRWSFQPSWLRIEPPARDRPLLLRASGKELTLGAFLGPDERRALADRLTAALQEWRTAA